MSFIKSILSKIVSAFRKQEPVADLPAGGWQASWSDTLREAIRKSLAELSSASDILTLRQDYGVIKEDQRIEVWYEFFKALAYYESEFDPNCQNVDVGTKNNPDSWSIGLLQLSVNDQSNYGLRFGYSFNDLLNPLNNLKFGVVILANQIKKRGKIFIPNHETGNPKAYFATLRPGNRYSKVDQILEVVSALKFKGELEDAIYPWMNVAEAEKGVSEVAGSKHNPRIVEYHQSTTLKAHDDETAWCASFVCWVLERAGYKSTKSAWARDYLKYGLESSPQYGCIVIFTRGTDSGHVGFYVKSDAEYIYVLGGNQNNQVNVSKYPKSRVLGYRWPVK